MTVTRIMDVAVAVRDVDAALGLFRNQLGLPVIQDVVLEDQGVRAAFLDTGDGEIVFMQPVRDGTGVGRWLEERGESIHHISFETDNIEADLAQAKADGIPLIDETPRRGQQGKVAFLRPESNFGALIALVQPSGPRPPGAPVPGDRPFRISGIDHVGFAVRDIAAAEQHFLHVYHLPVYKELGAEKETGLISVSHSIGRGYLEIITCQDPKDPINYVRKVLDKDGESLVMFSLLVDDLGKAVASLRGQGYEMTEPMLLDHKMVLGRPISHIPRKQAFGVRLQLLQAKK